MKAMAPAEDSWVWKEIQVRKRWSCCIREVEECRGCFQMLRTGQDRREEAATVQRERTQDKERKRGKGDRREKGGK